MLGKGTVYGITKETSHRRCKSKESILVASRMMPIATIQIVLMILMALA
jgi:hypothetical protein